MDIVFGVQERSGIRGPWGPLGRKESSIGVVEGKSRRWRRQGAGRVVRWDSLSKIGVGYHLSPLDVKTRPKKFPSKSDHPNEKDQVAKTKRDGRILPLARTVSFVSSNQVHEGKARKKSTPEWTIGTDGWVSKDPFAPHLSGQQALLWSAR